MKSSRLSRAARGVERRMFLKALGLGLAAPLAMKLANVATAEPSGRPKRFMLFFMPHGVPPEHFNPVVGSNPSDFTLSDSGVSILGPLEADYKKYVNVLQGFTYPMASTHNGVVTFLSGFADAGDETSPRTTVEHAIANGLGVRPLILGAVPHRPFGLDKDGKVMWDGQPVVPEKNPLKAYESVFGGLGSAPSTGGGTDPEIELTKAMHTLTEGELSALQTELRQLTSEQTKLQTHLEAIRALKSGGAGNQISCTTAPTLPALDTLRQSAQGQGDDWFLKEDNFPQILAAQLEVAAAALTCSSTAVVGVQSLYVNCDLDFKFMGAPGSHHNGLSHTQPNMSSGTTANLETRAPFAKAQRWFVEQLVEHTLQHLLVPDPADPGHTVLDNTIVMLCSEIGEGAWHTTSTDAIMTAGPPGMLSYMPIVLIGGGSGALKQQQVVNVSKAKATDRPAGDVYLSLCQAMGVSATFPTATGPVQEVLV